MSVTRVTRVTVMASGIATVLGAFGRYPLHFGHGRRLHVPKKKT